MFFVYVDFTDDGRPFYVGKGTQQRVNAKLRNKFHTNVARKHGHHRHVILATDDEYEAFNREIRLIAELHTFVNDPCWNEIGTNFTVGGEGQSGCVRSPELRAKIAASNKGLRRDAAFCRKNKAAQVIAQNRDDVIEKKRAAMLTKEMQLRVGSANCAHWAQRRVVHTCERCNQQGHFKSSCPVRLQQRKQFQREEILERVKQHNAVRGLSCNGKVVMLQPDNSSILTTFSSYVEASRVTSINAGNICQAALGRTNHCLAGGFLWRLKEPDLALIVHQADILATRWEKDRPTAESRKP